MTFSWNRLLLLIAVIIFAVAAVLLDQGGGHGWFAPPVLQLLGLTFFAGSFLV